MVREAMQYGGLIATARNSVLKTGGTASNRMGIDTSALCQLNKRLIQQTTINIVSLVQVQFCRPLFDKSPSR